MQGIEVPKTMLGLSVDHRGYRIPFFVATQPDGRRDFKLVCREAFGACVERGLCWICGEPHDVGPRVLVIGPIGTFNRISSEPPSHLACAEYAAKVCPFLLNRKYATQVGDGDDPVGAIPGNPGIFGMTSVKGDPIPRYLAEDRLLKYPRHQVRWVRWWSNGQQVSRDEAGELVKAYLLTVREHLDGAPFKARDIVAFVRGERGGNEQE